MASKTKRALAGVVVAVVVIAVVVAVWSRPPQRTGQTSEVGPVRATAPAELRVLAEAVTTRGNVVGSGSVDVMQRSAPESGQAIVATLPVAVGDEVANGELLVVVSGRPTFAVMLEMPLSRRIVPGTTGDDVGAIQASLSDLGYQITDPDGTFSTSTQAALEAFYRERGFVAPTVGGEDGAAAVEALRVEVENARARLAEAEVAVAADTTEIDATAVLDAARLELDHAQRSLSLVDATDPSAVETARQRIETAELAVNVAEQRLVAVRRDRTRQVALQSARSALETAEAALGRTEATSGPFIDISEFVAVSGTRVVVSEVLVTLGQTLNDATPIMRLSTGELAVRARLTDGQATLVADGMTAQVVAPDGSVLVGHIDGEPTDQATGDQTTMAATISLESTTGLRLGANVQVTITSTTLTERVLAVPTVAVAAQTSGQRIVLVPDGDGHREVRVDVGATAGGYTEITSSEPMLKPGDLVITAGAP